MTKVADQFAKAFQGLDIDSMKKASDDLLKKVSPLFEQIQNEQHKLAKPKSKKNTKWGDNNISVSLIEDGRVIITFTTVDEGEGFYKQFEQLKPLNWFGKLLRKCRFV